MVAVAMSILGRVELRRHQLLQTYELGDWPLIAKRSEDELPSLLNRHLTEDSIDFGKANPCANHRPLNSSLDELSQPTVTLLYRICVHFRANQVESPLSGESGDIIRRNAIV